MIEADVQGEGVFEAHRAPPGSSKPRSLSPVALSPPKILVEQV